MLFSLLTVSPQARDAAAMFGVDIPVEAERRPSVRTRSSVFPNFRFLSCFGCLESSSAPLQFSSDTVPELVCCPKRHHVCYFPQLQACAARIARNDGVPGANCILLKKHLFHLVACLLRFIVYLCTHFFDEEKLSVSPHRRFLQCRSRLRRLWFMCSPSVRKFKP